jgi:hypothetical protein
MLEAGNFSKKDENTSFLDFYVENLFCMNFLATFSRKNFLGFN